jgi:protoporphyrinogen oxidase
VPGFKPPGAGRFYYPRRAFGQISEAYAEAARAAGADLRLGWTVDGLVREGDVWRVSAKHGDERQQFEADHVWSTIPVTTIAKGIRPEAPQDVRAAADAIDYRAMVLIYMELPVAQFTEFDAHYFPGADTTITRLSENKNYMASDEPAGRTVLCAELPCMRGDDVWNRSDAEFGELLAADLERSGLPLPAAPTRVRTQRLPQAYPIYLDGYEVPFGKLDAWVETLPNFVSFGRQGLFAHDNTHHALFMAYRAAECLESGSFDRAAWARWRDVFRTHVVED